MGRSFGSPSWKGGERARRSPGRAISHAVWDLSSVIGRVALGIVCLVLIAMLLHQMPAVRDRILDVLPRRVAGYFRDDKSTPPAAERKLDGIRSRVGAVFEDPKARAADKSGARPRTFGMGSTKQEVMRIQGAPSRRTESTWYYGQSEVYFAGERVVGWRNSTPNPLRIE